MGRFERTHYSVTHDTDDEGEFQMRFKFEVKWDCQEIFFAFCYPWSLKDNDLLMERVETQLADRNRNDIYLHRETLCHSLEGRPVEIITLTANDRHDTNQP
eukprot:7952176-Pyramimonas_sp.AAC.1